MPPLADLLKCPRHHAAHTLRPRFDAFCLFLFDLPRLLSERDVQDALCCLLDKSYSKLLGALERCNRFAIRELQADFSVNRSQAKLAPRTDSD